MTASLTGFAAIPPASPRHPSCPLGIRVRRPPFLPPLSARRQFRLHDDTPIAITTFLTPMHRDRLQAKVEKSSLPVISG